jgi:hypothetical protein
MHGLLVTNGTSCRVDVRLQTDIKHPRGCTEEVTIQLRGITVSVSGGPKRKQPTSTNCGKICICIHSFHDYLNAKVREEKIDADRHNVLMHLFR